MIFTREDGETCYSLIREAFDLRKRKSAAYSLRAFARDLGISAETLSAFMKKKRGLSRSLAERIAKKLKVDEEDRNYFLDLAEFEYGRSALSRNLARERLLEMRKGRMKPVDVETFELISSWEHFAILELISLEGFEASYSWIADRLNVGEVRIRQAVDRLLRLKLLKIDMNGHWTVVGPFIAGPDGVPSGAVKRYHTQILEKALASIRTQAVEIRDISTVMLAFDSNQIDRAREVLKEFRRGFSKQMPRPRKTDALYCLNMNFFRIDTGAIEGSKDTPEL